MYRISEPAMRQVEMDIKNSIQLSTRPTYWIGSAKFVHMTELLWERYVKEGIPNQKNFKVAKCCMTILTYADAARGFGHDKEGTVTMKKFRTEFKIKSPSDLGQAIVAICQQRPGILTEGMLAVKCPVLNVHHSKTKGSEHLEPTRKLLQTQLEKDKLVKLHMRKARDTTKKAIVTVCLPLTPR